MKKVLIVEGMSCGHCSARVENALNAIDGVAKAKVDLKNKTATVKLTNDVADSALMDAVKEAGYVPVRCTVK